VLSERCTLENITGNVRCSACSAHRPQRPRQGRNGNGIAQGGEHWHGRAVNGGGAGAGAGAGFVPMDVGMGEAPAPAPTGDDFKDRCLLILHKLRQRPESGAFRERVREEDIPSYYHIISKPMYLSLVEQRVKSGRYEGSYQVRRAERGGILRCASRRGLIGFLACRTLPETSI
jgi:hypothetical protein